MTVAETTGTVLVTGFPGFLGSRLLPRILRRSPRARAACLVQPKFEALAKERVADLETAEPGLAGRIICLVSSNTFSITRSCLCDADAKLVLFLSACFSSLCCSIAASNLLAMVFASFLFLPSLANSPIISASFCACSRDFSSFLIAMCKIWMILYITLANIWYYTPYKTSASNRERSVKGGLIFWSCTHFHAFCLGLES